MYIYSLLEQEQQLIQEAVQAATNYWSKTIRPKYKLHDRIRLTRYSNKNKKQIFFKFYL